MMEMTDTPEYSINPEQEPIFVTDDEGELIFFCIKEEGQITEWVWL